jgi:hypothetical protein
MPLAFGLSDGAKTHHRTTSRAFVLSARTQQVITDFVGDISSDDHEATNSDTTERRASAMPQIGGTIASVA